MFNTQIYTDKKLDAVKKKAVELIQPQHSLEYDFLENENFLKGLDWGVPRYGHPEGKVLYHIVEVLANVHAIPNLTKKQLHQLRIITLVHDTFKFQEDKSHPRDWLKHHAIYARKFLEQYTSEKVLLDIVELHDEAYHIWRNIHLQHKLKLGASRKQQLLNRLGEHLQLYYLFFKCDTLTGDKILAPLDWFEQEIEGIEIINFK